MQDDDRDIVRVAITIGGVKSTISMDGRLSYYLGQKLGGDDKVRGWVRETVTRLEREWAAKAAEATTGERVRANTGLSRAIQREALDEVMSGVVFVQERLAA